MFTSACSSVPKDSELTFFAMDTYMTLRASGCDRQVLEEIRDEIIQMEGELSVTQETSSIAQLNREDRKSVV